MDNNEQTDNKRAKEEVLLFEKNKKMKNDIENSSSLLKKQTPKKSLDPSIQLEIIGKIRTKNEGPTYMYISKKWYVQFEGYGLGIKDRPSAIDNSELFQENGDKRADLVVNKDYYQLPINAWLHLENWYGVKNPSFIISTKEKDEEEKEQTKKSTTSSSSNKNDVNLKFQLFIVNKPSQDSYSFTASPNSTVSDFQTKLLSVLKLSLDTDNFELWLLNSQNRFFIETLTSSSSSSPFILKPTLFKQGDRYAKLIDPSTISPQSTISDCLSLMTISKPPLKNHYYLGVHFLKKPEQTAVVVDTTSRKPMTIGLCGLQNLGNSCYMNSAIQCLSNTPQLTQYFLSDKYKQHINRSSVLGLKGTLAEAYASLLKSIWYPNRSSKYSISPKEFKSTLEEFNEQFSGYSQQDSHELVGSLLDGLHEDLNKVLKKPYIESSDTDETILDMELADKSWEYHKSRDDSIIVDLFQGQYKSRLECDVCKKVSVTFDTFMYLSLPLPTETYHEISVIYVPYLPSQRLLSMSLQLNKEAKVIHLKQELENNILSSSLKIQTGYDLMVVNITDGKISKTFDNDDPISLIQTKDIIYVYQFPRIVDQPEKVVFPVYCSLIENQEYTQFGYPFLLVADKQESDLYSLLVHHLERYCIVKLFEEDDTQQEKVPQETVKEESTVQQPVIHTSAAVTPAGGRPMTPMKNLFRIRLFNSDYTSQCPFDFPLLDHTATFTWANNDLVVQGQGIVLEWDTNKALQVFGSSQQGISTEAWFDYDKTLARKKKRRVTLEDCLNEYTHDEKLSGEDAWYCPRCKELQCASKKIDIWKLPEIMVIHLKRFSQVRRWGNKVDTYVDFPLTDLDMTSRVLGLEGKQMMYDLYAVDNHYGGMHGGHYTAFAKNIETSDWYEFDDTRVSKISPEDVKTNAAYLLFYKRREYHNKI